MPDKPLKNNKVVEEVEEEDFSPAPELETPCDYVVKGKVVQYTLFNGFHCYAGTIINLPLSQAKDLEKQGSIVVLG